MAKLSDPSVQKSIADFISEARQCAQRDNGFAAMSTIFNVVLAVSEAVYKGATNKERIGAFVPQLLNKTSWLVKSGAPPSDDDIATLLASIRNGMAHALSLPKDVMLVNKIDDVRTIPESRRRTYSLSTADFIDVVEVTVVQLSQLYPAASFDPDPREPRGPGRGPAAGTFMAGTTTGSSVQVTAVSGPDS